MNIYDSRISFKDRINFIIDQLSVEQKISQLMHQSPAIPELGINAYNWWNEALHGVGRAGLATVFPQSIGIAATFNKELTFEMANIISTEGRAKYNDFVKKDERRIYKGLTFWSPNINIFRDPRWGRGQETYGEDPFLTASIGIEFVRGLQGDNEKYLKSIATPKHFYAHSGPEDSRHSFDTIISNYDKYNTYLYGFKKLIDAKAYSIMTAYNRVNGEPCVGSNAIINELLRNELGFKGVVVSDCGSIEDTHNGHRYAKNPVESCALSLKAGLDLECGKTYFHLKDALDERLITEDDINESLYRVLLTRFKLGEFDKEFDEYEHLSYRDVATEQSLEKSREIAAESFVLLKNDNILPITNHTEKSFLFVGPNTDSKDALIGNYSGTPKNYKTVLSCADKYIKNYAYAEGCHLYRDNLYSCGYKYDGFKEALILAGYSDVVVFCGGLTAELEGEEGDAYNPINKSGDRQVLTIPQIQTRLLKEIYNVNKNIIFVNFSGSPVCLLEEIDYCKAILQVWYPGGEGGEAIIDTILGKRKPKGRLPVTFYNRNNYLPDINDYSMNGRTYKYLDEKPLFNFGFGLDYDDIKISEFTVCKDSVNVTLSGYGKTTLQLYTTNENVKHKYKLVYFNKINVDNIKKINISLTNEMFGEYSENNELVNYAGSNKVFISLNGINDNMSCLDLEIK